MRKLRRALFTSVAIGGAAGCGESDAPRRLVDWADVAWVESNVIAAMYHGAAFSDADTPTDAAAAMARDAVTAVESELVGCATASSDGPHATFTFDHCNTPSGLVGLTGKITVTFVGLADPGGGFTIGWVFISAKSEGNVEANGMSFQLDGTAMNTQGRKQWAGSPFKDLPGAMSVSLHGKVYAPLGSHVDIVPSPIGSFTAFRSDDGTCLSLAAGVSGLVPIFADGVSYETSFDTSYTRCGGGCPREGELRVSQEDLFALVKFDGSATAQFSLSGPNDFEPLPLACTPAE